MTLVLEVRDRRLPRSLAPLGEFPDAVARIVRRPRSHAGWQSVRYRGRRYQLFGGIRNGHWISLELPLGCPPHPHQPPVRSPA